jgi:hypothetical protein
MTIDRVGGVSVTGGYIHIVYTVKVNGSDGTRAETNKSRRKGFGLLPHEKRLVGGWMGFISHALRQRGACGDKQTLPHLINSRENFFTSRL